MSLVLFRIDSRLLHGQFSTSWLPACRIERLVIISEKASNSPLSRQLLIQSAPRSLKLYIVTLAQAMCYPKQLFESDDTTAVLVDDVGIAAQLMERLAVTVINVGSLSYQVGKRQITDAIAVDERDVKNFESLHQAGCTLVYQKVVSDRPQDLWQILVAKKLVGKD